MKKKYIILGASLLALGLLLFGGAMTLLKWNFKGLSTQAYRDSVYTITDAFEDIEIHASDADVTFLPSADDTVTVTCFEEERLSYKASVTDGTLRIEPSDTRKWYHYIGISFLSPRITVSLPAGEYSELTVCTKTGDVNIPEGFSFDRTTISATTGNITLEGTKTGALDLSVSTGKITLQSVTAGDTKIAVSTGKTHLTDCKLASLDTKGGTGGLWMRNVLVGGILQAKRSTGDITLEECDAGEVSITTDTGDVTASFLSEKIVFANTSTGKVVVPQSTSGGKCAIKTDTGDIKVKLVPKE